MGAEWSLHAVELNPSVSARFVTLFARWVFVSAFSQVRHQPELLIGVIMSWYGEKFSRSLQFEVLLLLCTKFRG